MNQAELTILDKSIEHQLALLRFTAGEKRKVEKLLLQLQIELKNKLQNGLTSFSEKRVNKLLAESQKMIDAFYKGLPDNFDLKELAKTEAAATASIFGEIGLDAAMPTAAALKAMASIDVLQIQGYPCQKWWAKQSTNLIQSFTSQVNLGLMANETQQQIIMRVFGSKRKGIPGIGFPENITRANASTLVHDMVMQISADAHMQVYKENEDIINGYYWLATLDSHTCRRCMAYEGAEWDLDYQPINGNTLSFKKGDLHPGCRCVVLPKLKSYKELGYDIKEPPPGTRASDLGQIKADTSFDSFLKRHSVEYQNDKLGKGRAQMWRDGKITLKDLVSGNGRELSLKELKERYLK